MTYALEPPPKIPPAPSPPCEASEPLARLIQASIVKSCSCRLAGLPTETPSPLPSKTNACPTRPGPKVVLPTSVPLLVPAWSNALPSARHQLTSPEGGATQEGGT